MKARARKLLRRMMAEKGKFSTMLCLVMVALLMWGRLLLKQVPRTAVATPEQVALDVLPQRDPLSERQTAEPLQPIELDLPALIGRDLFAVDASRYPSRGNPAPLPEVVEKSRPDATDEVPKAREIVEQAAALRLHSTLHDGRERAVISGRLLAVGQEIDGFTLVRVMNRRVLLRKMGFEVWLEM